MALIRLPTPVLAKPLAVIVVLSPHSLPLWLLSVALVPVMINCWLLPITPCWLLISLPVLVSDKASVALIRPDWLEISLACNTALPLAKIPRPSPWVFWLSSKPVVVKVSWPSLSACWILPPWLFRLWAAIVTLLPMTWPAWLSMTPCVLELILVCVLITPWLVKVCWVKLISLPAWILPLAWLVSFWLLAVMASWLLMVALLFKVSPPMFNAWLL